MKASIKQNKSSKSELTLTQRKRAAKAYSNLMTNIATSQRFIEQYGEPLYCLKTLDVMNQNGLISDNEFDSLADLLLFLEISRQAKIKLAKMAVAEGEQEPVQEVDTSRLLAGMTVKNYKTLCNLLGEEPKTGKSKTLQMQKWQNYFDFEQNKYSHEIIILEVYAEPMTPAQRKHRNSAFINEMKVLILNKLNQLGTNSKGNIIFFATYNQLIDELGVIDPCLTDKQYCFDIQELLFNFLKQKFGNTLSDGQIKFNFATFKENTMSKIRDAIDNALKALQRDDMVSYCGQYVLASRNSENGTTVYTVADDNQTAIILQTQKETANQLGYINSRTACQYSQKEYYKLFNPCISKRLNCDYCFYRLKVITSKANLEKHISEYTCLADDRSVTELTNDSIKDFGLRYNQNLTTALKEQADTMQQKKTESFLKQLQQNNPDFNRDDLLLFLDPNTQPQLAKYGDSFRHTVNRLIDLFVNQSNNDDDLQAFHDKLDKMQTEIEKQADSIRRKQRLERFKKSVEQ